MSQLLEDQFKFSINLSFLLEHLRENSYRWSMGETYRTKEQAEIYAEKGLGVINSQHCKRLAQDIFLFKQNQQNNWELINDKEIYKPIGKYWKMLNDRNKWGGDFISREDPYHFEMQE